jgi:hypothetical protein
MDCLVASAPLHKRFAFVAGNDELGTNITRLIVVDASANIEL